MIPAQRELLSGKLNGHHKKTSPRAGFQNKWLDKVLD